MGKHLPVAQIFEYCPGAINLVGFPDSPILHDLSYSLGREVSLKRYNEYEYGRRTLSLIPSFPPEYAEKRQEFFQRLPDSRITKYLFERTFPKGEDAGRSDKDFLHFCQRVYETIEAARKQLKDFKHFPEARAVLRRLDGFDGDLEATLRALKSIDDTSTFAADTESGVIVPIDKMPAGSEDAHYRTGTSREWTSYFENSRVKMKKVALQIAKQGRTDFKQRVVRFVMDEFGFGSESENLRKCFEQLAVPVRLHSKYREFLDWRECADERGGGDEDSDVPINDIPEAIYPRFGGTYKIENLVPLSLLNRWGAPREFVPINFKTNGERKFLIAGLHSGGKSFFLENIVLASILGQLGESMPADFLMLPQYEGIFYYRNTDNSGNGKGKCDKEMKDTLGIAQQAGRKDALFFDEFLDSAEEAVAPWLVPDLLKKLGESGATVFVSTHRSPDYRKLAKDGWAIMTPDHRIDDGKVVPARKLKRGFPDRRANRRYMQEKYADALNKLTS